MKASFFVAGFPKCGTTSLCSWLAQHPQVVFPVIKEPHFFSKDLGNDRVPTLERYEALFSRGGMGQVAGEGSTNYLYSDVAIDEILNYNPDAKFIVCVRHPVDLLPSLFQQYKNHLGEPARDFSTAWAERGREYKWEDVGFLTNDGLINYRAAGSLGRYTERLLNKVPRNQVFFVKIEDMKSDPANVYAEVLRFLGLEKREGIQFKSHNERKQLRRPILRRIQMLAGKLKRSLGIDRNFGIFRPLSKMTYGSTPDNAISKSLEKELLEKFEMDWKSLESLINQVHRSI